MLTLILLCGISLPPPPAPPARTRKVEVAVTVPGPTITKEVPPQITVCPHCKKNIYAPVKNTGKFKMMDRKGNTWSNDNYERLLDDVFAANNSYQTPVNAPMQMYQEPVRLSVGGCAGGSCGSPSMGGYIMGGMRSGGCSTGQCGR